MSRRRSRFVELWSRPPHRLLFTAPRYFFDVDYTHILQRRRILGELAMLEGEGDSPCFDYSVIDVTPTLFRRTIPLSFSLCCLPFIRRKEETDVWGTLTEENSVIFHDNDVSGPAVLCRHVVPLTILIVNITHK